MTEPRFNLVPRPHQDAEHLFGLILPRDGYRAGATSWQPRDSDSTALYNRLFKTNAELAQWATEKGTASNVWHATASFRDAGGIARDLRSGFKGSRDESNIHSRETKLSLSIIADRVLALRQPPKERKAKTPGDAPYRGGAAAFDDSIPFEAPR
jgi:hypothetical protein